MRKSRKTQSKYEHIIYNYAQLDGCTISEYQQKTKTSPMLMYSMESNGLFQRDESGVYHAVNADRKRAVYRRIVDRIIEDAREMKRKENAKWRERKAAQEAAENGQQNGHQAEESAQPQQLELAAWQHMPRENNAAKVEEMENHAIHFLRNSDRFEQVCIDYLKAKRAQDDQPKYKILLNKIITKIETIEL